MRQTKSNHSAVRRPAKKFIAGLLSAAALLVGLEAQATTYYSKGATGDPTQLTSWTNSANATPANFTSGDTFVILNGCTFKDAQATTTNDWTISGGANLQINSGGTLDMNGAHYLNLGGNFVQNGSFISSLGTTIQFTTSGSNWTWTGSGDLSGSTQKILVTVNSGVTLDASGLSNAGLKLKTGNTVYITVSGTLNMGTKTIDANNNNSGTYNLQVNSGGTIITARAGGLGTALTSSTGTLTNFYATGRAIINSAANVVYNGTSAQVTGAILPTPISGLTFSNSAGVTLSQAMTVTNLTLTAGKVTGNVTLGSAGTISGGSSASWLNGQLTVPFSAPSGISYTFPVGTGYYTPVTLANFSDASGGSLTVGVTAGTQPNLATSGIDASLYITRYWTLTGTGFTSPSYNFIGTYNGTAAVDNPNNVDTNNLVVRKWDGSSWAAPASSSSANYTVTGTGFTTSFGQFAVGQLQTTVPILDNLTKSAITNTSATLGATLENNFSVSVTNYGIVWGTTANPTTSSNVVQVGSSTPTLGSPFTGSATGLPVATTVYYRGYAINTNGQTGYSTNGSFLTLANEPTVQSTAVVCSSLQNGSIPIAWVRGNGSKCIVVVSAGAPVSSAPVDGTTYTFNATYGSGAQIGSGNYVAYLGTGTNITLTGLTTSTIYYVAVYELNGSSGSENYFTVSPATGNQTTPAAFITTLTWTGGGTDSDWNNTANWDQPYIPDVGTAVVIPLAPANQPTYSNQMTAASFGTLTSAGILNVNTNGFNSGALTLNNVAESGSGTGAKLYIGSNGVMNVSGAIVATSNAWITVASGGSLTASGALNLGVSGGATAGSVGIVTNNGGTINVASTGVNPGNGSLSSTLAGSGNCLFVINGGVNNLGSVVIKRSTSSGFPTIGRDGLAIYGGQVTMSGLDVGNNSANSSCSALVAGGIVTNNGSVFVGQLNTRVSRFLQTGGLFVVTNLANPNPITANSTNVYAVVGGTNLVGGILFGPASSGAGNIFFTNGAVMYVGSQGINANSGIILAAALTDGSQLGASADWTGSVPLNLVGTTETFRTADLGGTPHNITYNGVLSGSGNLNVTGGGILTLGAANTYSGSTLIGSGTLALSASGSLTSPQIMLGSGTTFDVSALGGAYSQVSGQTLSGFGNIAGQVTATAGSIQPGSNSVTGTLTFGGGLSENGVNNNFVLPGDKIVIGAGTTLSVSGANVVQIIGAVYAGADYTLFDYSGGSFSGSVASFTLAGVNGYLTNDVTAQAIKLHALSSQRAPTTIVWTGNSTANDWDAGVTTNWLNAGALDDFLTGDTAVFGDLGGVNPYVNIAGSVSPGLVVVNTSSNYVFAGVGSISGSGGITVSNGSLTIATTNSYTGPTVLAGGVLVISNIANGTVASPIGAASVAAANVVFNGGTLDYFGPTASTDHGITLTNGGGVIDVPGGTTLTLNGSITGNGGLTKIDTGGLTLATASSYSGNTVVSNGVLTLNDSAAAGSSIINLYGGNLKIGTVKPNNTVNVAGNAQVSGGNGGGATGIKNVTGSANLLLAVTTGVFDLTGDMSAYSGTITCSNAGGGGIRLNGSKGSALATWDLGVGTMDLNERAGSTSNNIGALKGGSSTTLSGRGGSSNSGATTYYIGANNLSTEFDGIIQNGNGTSGTTPSTGSPTSINKVGSGTLTLNGVSTFTGTAVINGGAISGVGTISGATTFNANTVLAPGTNGVGVLTFGGNLTLNAASTNSFAVTTAGGASNSVAVSGTLTPNSSVIQITSGTALAVGTYTLFTHAGISGSFNATPVFDVAPAAAPTIVDTGTKINLVIGTPAGPVISGVTPSGADLILNATGGSAGGSVSVLTSTDVSLPLASWTVVTTGNYDGAGNFSYTVSGALSSGQPQQFYILQQ